MSINDHAEELMYQSMLLIIAGLISAPGFASAQNTGFWGGLETGGAISANRNMRSGYGAGLSTAWSLRSAFMSKPSPWGAEINIEYGTRRPVAGFDKTELGTSLSLVRRLGKGLGRRGTGGTYVGLGYNLSVVDVHLHTQGAKLRGAIATLGQRMTVGSFGVFRSEVVVLRDWGKNRRDIYYPGVTRLAVRLGFAFTDPMGW